MIMFKLALAGNRSLFMIPALRSDDDGGETAASLRASLYLWQFKREKTSQDARHQSVYRLARQMLLLPSSKAKCFLRASHKVIES